MQMLYHETQWGALCGVHAINTLLQGPWISEVDLAQIAQDLDQQERQLLGGESWAADDTGNVDGSGMFSSQVLSVALKTWDLTIHPITSPEMAGVAEEPQKESAFICNLQEHWFTIRKVGDSWYNFNSIAPAPEALGTFYLAAYLASLREQGYTVFVVRGALPVPAQPNSEATQGTQGRWYTPEQARSLHETASTARQAGKTLNTVEQALARAAAGGGVMQLRSRKRAGEPMEAEGGGPAGFAGAGNSHDEDLAAAIAASLADQGAAGGSSAMDVDAYDEDAALAAALAASQQDPLVSTQAAAGTSAAAPSGAAGTSSGSRYAPAPSQGDEDADLAAALAASQEDALAAALAAGDEELVAALAVAREADRAEAGSPHPAAPAAPTARAQPSLEPLEAEPEAAEGVIELAFRLPGGSRVLRRFQRSSHTAQLYSFLSDSQHLAPGSFTVSTQFPRKEVVYSTSDTLADAALENRQVLSVDTK